MRMCACIRGHRMYKYEYDPALQRCLHSGGSCGEGHSGEWIVDVVITAGGEPRNTRESRGRDRMWEILGGIDVDERDELRETQMEEARAHTTAPDGAEDLPFVQLGQASPGVCAENLFLFLFICKYTEDDLPETAEWLTREDAIEFLECVIIEAQDGGVVVQFGVPSMSIDIIEGDGLYRARRDALQDRSHTFPIALVVTKVARQAFESNKPR
ncbi:hypothetical protein L226DRAFT_601210 [Lentinus tigrinus ALCF2SS1-7]|uniref:uncharacterized protein n=1 Tax=Lentinus tigrinus ALCF2SS1-7 TaxID=1328758 RepID=UPI001165EB99|nr:hypothetical protein L226DRAFT_601210 [Lentinus tigrinus ALCF2SS1-7]